VPVAEFHDHVTGWRVIADPVALDSTTWPAASQVVRISPDDAFVIGAAVGGRTTLLGPAIGAVAVAWAQTTLSEQYPATWSYLQGGLFILVVAFLPGGLASLAGLARRWLPAGRPASAPAPAPGGTSEVIARP